MPGERQPGLAGDDRARGAAVEHEAGQQAGTEEARLFRPGLLARFVLNRCAARTVIARETRLALAGHEPAALLARIGQRVAFADAARSGRLVCDLRPQGIAAREIAALTAEIGGLVS